MHAMKFVVGAAAALLVGATSAQSVDDSPLTSSASSQPWATGELWGSETAAQLSSDDEAHGAQGRSYESDSMSSTNSIPSGRSSQPMLAGEAYDGQGMGASTDGSSGAFGRSFGESGMSQGEPAGDPGQRGSAEPSSNRLSHFHGG